MKMLSFVEINLSLILLFFSFKRINSQEDFYCKDQYGQNTAKNYISGLKGPEAYQKCFSLSYNYNNKMCCHSDLGCVNKKVNNKTICPNTSIVYNNCGKAGIYQPETISICKDFPPVQGHCCYVKLNGTADGTACIRTKKLGENKAEPTSQIIHYIKSIDNSLDIEYVECNGSSIKYYWLLTIAIIMLLYTY